MSKVLSYTEMPLDVAIKVLSPEDLKSYLRALMMELLSGVLLKGDDGKDVDMKEVDLIVEKHLRELSPSLKGDPGKDGIYFLKDAILEAPEIILDSPEIAEALRGKDGEDGEDGEDGKDVDMEVVNSKIEDYIESIAGRLTGKDGKDVDIVEVQNFISKYINQISPSLKGQPGTDGKDVDMVDVNNKVESYIESIAPSLKGEKGDDLEESRFEEIVTEAVNQQIKKHKLITDIDIKQDVNGDKLILHKVDGSKEEEEFKLVGQQKRGTTRNNSGRIRRLEAEVFFGEGSGPGGELTDLQVMTMANFCPKTRFPSTGAIQGLNYDDFDGITNHTKNFTYTGEDITQAVEVFDYAEQNWTVTTTYSYIAGNWQSSGINLVKV